MCGTASDPISRLPADRAVRDDATPHPNCFAEIITAPSLKRHVQAFRNVGAEAGGDDDAAAEFLRGGVAGPDRIAAGAEERIGVGRLGLGGVELIMRVGL